jgi:hypothetical protein
MVMAAPISVVTETLFAMKAGEATFTAFESSETFRVCEAV